MLKTKGFKMRLSREIIKVVYFIMYPRCGLNVSWLLFSQLCEILLSESEKTKLNCQLSAYWNFGNMSCTLILWRHGVVPYLFCVSRSPPWYTSCCGTCPPCPPYSRWTWLWSHQWIIVSIVSVGVAIWYEHVTCTWGQRTDKQSLTMMSSLKL